MSCKCGSRRKKGSADFVAILAKELNFNIKRTLSGLASSPIFVETAEQFCAAPARSWHQFNFLGFNNFNSLIDKRWSEFCECKPEEREWTIVTKHRGRGINGASGGYSGGITTFVTRRTPYGAKPVVYQLVPNQPDLTFRVLGYPPNGGAFYVIGVIISNFSPNLLITVEDFSVTSKPVGCFPPTIPLPFGGNYPNEPPPFGVQPPPSFAMPRNPPLPTKPPKPPRVSPRLPPPDECCDCC